MITKFYKWMAAGTVTSLLLATLAVAPVAAQSSSGNGQSSDQSQAQGMNQGNNQSGQNQGQGSCVAFAQSMGQGMSQGNNQNGQNGNNGNNDQNGNNQNGNNGQAALGTGPGNAATPMANCWLSIGPGQKQWYKFHVGARSNKGDENNNFDNANGVDDSDAAIAELTMDTQGCIAFEIWTQERLTAAQNGVKDDDKLLGPVGAGSPEFVINKNNDNSSDNSSSNNSSSANSDKNLNRGRLLWRGGSTVREDFLLVVRNLRSDSTCSYRLSVAGPTVSFPGANNSANNAANGSNNGNNNNNGNNGGNNSSNNNSNNGSNNNGSSNGNNNNG